MKGCAFIMIPTPEKRVAEFEEMGFGIFVHWGLYSQLEQGEWTMEIHDIPKDEYVKLKDTFTAAKYDASRFVKTVKQAGAKYIVLTTKHHEGFFMYDTLGLCDYDAPHSPAQRDLVKEFVDACNAEGIKPIFYHATFDWYEKHYNSDFDVYLEYLRKSVEILCQNYGEIGGFWFDGNWDKKTANWKLDELYGTIRKYQPNAMIINNTGLSRRGLLEHNEIDSVTFEQGNPEPINREGMEKYVAGEMCQTMNKHWGNAHKDLHYKSTTDLIETLCRCRKAGANYLLNVGPDQDGNMTKMQEAMLEIIGQWMEINGEAIHRGRPCEIKAAGNGKDFALKASDGQVYLFIHDLKVVGNVNVMLGGEGENPRCFLNMHEKINGLRWMDNDEELTFTQDEKKGILCFDATGYPYGTDLVVRVAKVY